MISVGIVYFNEFEQMKVCLRSIFSGSNPNYISQVIVVSNTKFTDALIDVIKSYEVKFNKINFKIVKNKNNNIGESRRLLALNCESAFLSITDPDCEVSPNWLKNYLEEYAKLIKVDQNIASLCGPVKIKSNFKIYNFLQKNKIKTFSPQIDISDDPVLIDHSQTSNAFYIVEKLLSVGSFSLAHKKSGEDLELGLRLKANQLNNYSIGRASVTHDLTSTKLGFTKRFYKLGLGQLNPYLGERKIHMIVITTLILFVCSILLLKAKVLAIILFIPLVLLLKISVMNQLGALFAFISYSVGYIESFIINELG